MSSSEFRPGVPSILALAATLAFGANVPMPSAAQGVEFGASPIVSVGNSPGPVAVSDLNLDGHLDVVLANQADRDLQLLFGSGDGSFGESRTFPTASGAGSLVVEDLDGDGDLDVALAGNSGVEVWLGDGAFEFFRAGLYLEDRYPRSIVAGDFDEDGSLDLAAVPTYRGDVYLLRGIGSGSFAPPESVFYGASEGRRLVSADVNGDGHLDLVSIRQSDALWTRVVLLGDGSGVFEFQGSFGTNEPGGIAVGDLDEDGMTDIALTSLGEVRIYLGPGISGGAPPTFPTSGFARSAAVADVDGDGHLDVVTGASAGQIASLHGNGGGSLSPPIAVGGATDSAGLAIGDVDEDGALDVVVSNSTVRTLSIVLGDGAGSFIGARLSDAPSYAHEMARGDFDGDGHADLVMITGEVGSPDMSVLGGDGTGAFPRAAIYRIGKYLRGLAVADFDEDGRLDIATAEYFDGRGIVVLLGDGAGGLLLQPDALPVPGISNVVTADFDRDGHADLATGSYRSGRSQLEVYLGDGTAGFVPRPRILIPSNAGWLAAGDVTGDGIVDLVGSNSIGTIAAFVGSGDGRFTTGPVLPGHFLYQLVLADAVTGGALEIVTADYRSASISIFLVGAAGSISGPKRHSVIDWPSDLAVSDFDEDGSLDVAASYILGGAVSVSLGDGLGGFVSRRIGSDPDGFVVGFTGSLMPKPTALQSSDFDEDGHADLAVGALGFGPLYTLINRSFDPGACRVGNVNARLGPAVDVLFVNGQAGAGRDRSVEIGIGEPVVIAMSPSPSDSDGRSEFVLYGWTAEPTSRTVRTLPGGIGRICHATPFTGGRPRPKAIWNNFRPRPAEPGRLDFGAPTAPSSAAPSLVLSLPRGFATPISFFLQGLIEDPASPSRWIAVTNGLAVRIE